MWMGYYWDLLSGACLLCNILFLFLILFFVSTRKCQCMPILEIEVRQFKISIRLPSPKTDQIIELLLSEKYTQYTFVDNILSRNLFALLLNLLSFPLMLIFELKNFFRSIFIFSSELSQEFSHFLNLLFKIFVVFFHEGKFLLSSVSLIKKLLGELVWRNDLLL